LILYTRKGMYEATLIRDRAITSNKNIVGDRLSENFYFENIGDNFFGFPVDIGVDKGNVVVACDNISKGR